MKPNVLFVSDTHFHHESLIKKGHRIIPFDNPTIEKHDNMLIERWNDVVGKNDHVYHLGDFAWINVGFYRKQLNGRIHLVKGNHDRLKSSEKTLFESIDSLKEIKVGDQKIVLCHYAMRTWRNQHYGAWHLYGHSHGSLAEDPNALSFDVGVDCWAFTPVSYEQVFEKMQSKRFVPIDHHT